MWRMWQSDDEESALLPSLKTEFARSSSVHIAFLFLFIARGDNKFKINKEKPSINRIFNVKPQVRLCYLII